MKPIAIFLLLTSAGMVGQDAPQVTRAAKVKPDSKWADRQVYALADYFDRADSKASPADPGKDRKLPLRACWHSWRSSP
jgi:hypothetical protein